jgi:hypothetical protein
MKGLPDDMLAKKMRGGAPGEPLAAAMEIKRRKMMRDAAQAQNEPAPQTTVAEDLVGSTGLGSVAPQGYDSGGLVEDVMKKWRGLMKRRGVPDPQADPANMRKVIPPQLHIDPRTAASPTGVLPTIGTGNVPVRSPMPSAGRTPQPYPDIPADPTVVRGQTFREGLGALGNSMRSKLDAVGQFPPAAQSGPVRGRGPVITPQSISRGGVAPGDVHGRAPLIPDVVKNATIDGITKTVLPDVSPGISAWADKQMGRIGAKVNQITSGIPHFAGSGGPNAPVTFPPSAPKGVVDPMQPEFNDDFPPSQALPPRNPDVGYGPDDDLNNVSLPATTAAAKGGTTGMPGVATAARKQMLQQELPKPPTVGGSDPKASPTTGSGIKALSDKVKENLANMSVPNFTSEISKEIAKLQKNLKDEKAGNFGDSLLRIGAAIAGGTSQYAGVNIGKGITEGMKGIDERDRAQKEQELKLLGARTTIASAEQNMWITKQDLAYKLANGDISQAQADRQIAATEHRNQIAIWRAEYAAAVEANQKTPTIKTYERIIGKLAENWNDKDQEDAKKMHLARSTSSGQQELRAARNRVNSAFIGFEKGNVPDSLRLRPSSIRNKDGELIPYGSLMPTSGDPSHLREIRRMQIDYLKELYAGDMYVQHLLREQEAARGIGAGGPQVQRWTGPGSVVPQTK